ncbi:hypothetical protein [Sediminibacterium sp.]|uniref:hypothetical protein n=1 Tax=Sediminibacterium sp. TaxID=1917865 RepID=UPI0025E49B6C|nr:hypothetical protein [Sediminibacterium sp.]MBW0176923.1 hypothetical protein [Sediminibacterium sp.]
MQKVKTCYAIVLLLCGFNDVVSAHTSMGGDTIIKSLVTLKEYPITNLASVPAIKRDDPKVYYGKWQWVNDNRDTFTITMMPGKAATTKDVTVIQSDIVCYYTIIRQGQLVESTVPASLNSERAVRTELYGYAMENRLLISFPTNITSLDGSIYCELQLAANNKERGILKNGAYLPCLIKAFNSKPTASGNNTPADLLLHKISNTY